MFTRDLLIPDSWACSLSLFSDWRWCLLTFFLLAAELPASSKFSCREMVQITTGVEGPLFKLKNLLENLPPTLPEPAIGASKYPFIRYQPDPDDIELTGSVTGALNRRLEVIFGFESQSKGDGIIQLEECGLNICALVNVLGSALKQEPENAILMKWVVDLTQVAAKVYQKEGIAVSTCIFVQISNVIYIS